MINALMMVEAGRGGVNINKPIEMLHTFYDHLHNTNYFNELTRKSVTLTFTSAATIVRFNE